MREEKVRATLQRYQCDVALVMCSLSDHYVLVALSCLIISPTSCDSRTFLRAWTATFCTCSTSNTTSHLTCALFYLVPLRSAPSNKSFSIFTLLLLALRFFLYSSFFSFPCLQTSLQTSLHSLSFLSSFFPSTPHLFNESNLIIMSIIYALVARGTIILAEYTNSSGNFTTGKK